MGANFQTMKLDGSLDRVAVGTKFEDAQDEDRYENGHSYSGGFGMATGLLFSTEPTFPSEDAAYDYLNNAAEKWGEAVAIRFRDSNSKEQWMIGANCAS